MEFNFLEQQEKRNLLPLEIPSKKNYFSDLFQLENSFVSRVDVFIANTFFMESVQLIKNGISLFEKGYFDSAYYSLRQSLETALTMVYLSDLEEDKREKELLKWKEKSRFPMYKAMSDLLEKQMAIFSDVKEKMSDYFDELEQTKRKLNKYVHKQGFDTFYVSRTRKHFFNKTNQTDIIQEFEDFVEKCIGAITVFRLCIDPFPVLLMDEEIYTRTEVFMSDALSSEFIEKYVGIKNIEKYKQTNIYKDNYAYFIEFEKMLPAVLGVKKYKYIDKRKINEILSQRHLLRTKEIQAIAIAMMLEKVTRIMPSDFTVELFWTNTKSVRERWGVSMEKYLELQNRDMTVLNFPIDNGFISTIDVGGENFLIEHNQVFDFEEFETFQAKARNKFNEIVTPV